MKKLFLVSLIVFAMGSCTGDPGPTGPPGPAGEDGTVGQDGEDFPGPLPDEYINADGILGGAAYSKWYSTDAGGSGDAGATVSADFYRCKACHAWDGLGNAGSYANRTGQSTLKATRPDVSSVNLRSSAVAHTVQALFDLVVHSPGRTIDAPDNTHPDFLTDLTVAQVWNLVKFMREEWVEPALLYDLAVSGAAMYVDYTVPLPVVVAPTLTYSNIGALGDAANGNAVYTANCASCHGADGTAIDIEGRSVGLFAREKPNELWFKAKFGEPGTGMNPGLVAATSDLQDLYAALVDETNYPPLP